MITESRHRRAFVRSALTTALLLPGGFTSLIGAALAQRAPRQGVARMRGEVLINGKKASAGSVVAPGDTVRTGPKSYATFVVGEDAFLVRGQTEVELGGVERLVNLVRIVTGGLLSVYSKGPERSLRTSTATIGIRGTGAYLEVSPQRTYFCLCYGVAELVPAAAPDQTELLRTLHHDQPRFVYPAGGDRVVERAPVIDHRDAELVLLESLVGREPPFVDTDEYRSGVRY